MTGRSLLHFALGTLLMAHQAEAADACLHSAIGTAFSGSTISATIAGVAAGHTLRVAVCMQNGTLTLSGMTFGGTSGTVLAHSTGNNANENCNGAYFPNSGSGSIVAVATVVGTCANCSMAVEEWSGDNTTTPLDGDNATYTAGASSTVSSGSFTTTANGDDIWAIIFQPQSVAPTLQAGYSAGCLASAPWWSEHLTQVSAGATNPNFTSGAGSFDNYVIGAGFKAPASAGGGGGSLLLMGVGH